MPTLVTDSPARSIRIRALKDKAAMKVTVNLILELDVTAA